VEYFGHSDAIEIEVEGRVAFEVLADQSFHDLRILRVADLQQRQEVSGQHIFDHFAKEYGFVVIDVEHVQGWEDFLGTHHVKQTVRIEKIVVGHASHLV